MSALMEFEMNMPVRQREAALGSSRPLHTLPLELLHRILSLVLVSEDDLAFCRVMVTMLEWSKLLKIHENRQAASVNHYLKGHRFARLGHCDFHDPVATALLQDYNCLAHSSRYIRKEAQDVFFGKNRWVLHVAPRHVNSIDLISEMFGLHALRKMIHVKILMQSLNAGEDFKHYEQLRRFVDLSAPESSLKYLGIEFSTGSAVDLHHTVDTQSMVALPSPSPPKDLLTVCSHFPRLYKNSDHQRIAGLTRIPWLDDETTSLSQARAPWYHSSADSIQSIAAAEEAWALRQICLSPLQALRGITSRVTGEVTKEWGDWLQRQMAMESASSSRENDGHRYLSVEARKRTLHIKAASTPDEYADLCQGRITTAGVKCDIAFPTFGMEDMMIWPDGNGEDHMQL